MTAMQEIAKGFAAPAATVVVLGILYEGGADLPSLVLALLVAMGAILWIGGR
jgi:hypothetical protein